MSTPVGDVFERCRGERRAAFIAYLVAGYPDLSQTPALIEAAVAGGADIIELGFPYSDPLADGPTIQAAAHQALERGAHFEAVLGMARAQVGAPILAFSYYNPLFVRGLARTAADLKSAGFTGAIVPDLPLEEAEPLLEAFGCAGLSVSFLVAPTTPLERARSIATRCSDFVYVVSRMGVTGAQLGIGPEAQALTAALRGLTDKPLAVGFGVSQPEQVASIARYADGVIVGSALVTACAAPEPASAVREACQRLGSAAKK